MGTSLLSPAGGGSSHGSLSLGVNDRRGVRWGADVSLSNHSLFSGSLGSKEI